VVPTSFAGVDSFDKMRFRLIAGHLPILLREIETGVKGDILPFHLIAQHATRIVVLPTVILTSFAAVDSFNKVRLRLIIGHLSISLWETETRGEG
jgi:hypothetical protein